MHPVGAERWEWLRRFGAAALLAVFSLVLLAPVAFASGESVASLPICCRAHGKHQCMRGISMTAAEASGPSAARFERVPETCPFLPAMLLHAQNGDRFVPVFPGMLLPELLAHPAQLAQTEAKWRISFDRSRQKRGPPPTILPN
jgi:hypothetical protein